MTLNQFCIPTLLIGLMSTVSLLGCQHTLPNPPIKTIPATSNISDNNWLASTPKPRLFQTITKYQWQLTHVTDENDQIQSFNHKPPLIMQVRPEVLLFTEGCHRYQGSFGVWRPLPYPYSLPDISDLPDNCGDVSELSGGANSLNKGDIQRALEVVFAPYSDSYFRFDPLLSNSPLFSKNKSKQLALTTDKGKTFIFSGTANPVQKTSGIPITNELLEHYQWRLISATHSTNNPISELNHSGIPITAKFEIDFYSGDDFQQSAYNQSVRFFTGCNGVGGSYALSSNQTLLIGISPATLMGCGDLLNGIENYLDRIMHNSSSRLNLSLQNQSVENEQSFPRYNLLQTMDTGETLIWKSEPKDSLR